MCPTRNRFAYCSSIDELLHSLHGTWLEPRYVLRGCRTILFREKNIMRQPLFLDYIFFLSLHPLRFWLRLSISLFPSGSLYPERRFQRLCLHSSLNACCDPARQSIVKPHLYLHRTFFPVYSVEPLFPVPTLQP